MQLVEREGLAVEFELLEVRAEELLLGRGDNRLDGVAASAGSKLRPVVSGHLVHLDLVDQALNGGLLLLELGRSLLPHRRVADRYLHALDEPALDLDFLCLRGLIQLAFLQSLVASLRECVVGRALDHGGADVREVGAFQKFFGKVGHPNHAGGVVVPVDYGVWGFGAGPSLLPAR